MAANTACFRFRSNCCYTAFVDYFINCNWNLTSVFFLSLLLLYSVNVRCNIVLICYYPVFLYSHNFPITLFSINIFFIHIFYLFTLILISSIILGMSMFLYCVTIRLCTYVFKKPLKTIESIFLIQCFYSDCLIWKYYGLYNLRSLFFV